MESVGQLRCSRGAEGAQGPVSVAREGFPAEAACKLRAEAEGPQGEHRLPGSR